MLIKPEQPLTAGLVNWILIMVVTLVMANSLNVRLIVMAQEGTVQGQVEQVQEREPGQEEGQLMSGGVFKGIDGIKIQAPASEICIPNEGGSCNDTTMTNTVNVFTRITEDPTAQYPLPEGWIAISPFYSIGSVQGAYTRGNGKFNITFKVPKEHDLNTIGIVSLNPSWWIVSEPSVESEMDLEWTPAVTDTGVSENTITVETSRLTKEGLIYVLLINSQKNP